MRNLLSQCKALPFDGSSGISDASQIETDTPTVIVTSNVTGLVDLNDEDVYIVCHISCTYNIQMTSSGQIPCNFVGEL